MPELVARTGLLEADLRKAASAASLTVLHSPQFWLLDPGGSPSKLEALHEHLKLFHRQNPLLAGVSKEELRSKFLPGAPPWLMDALAGALQDTGGPTAKPFAFRLIKSR